MAFKIIGTGSALPKTCITNDDMSTIVNTSDEWIVSKTGIKQRYILGDETLSDLAQTAATDALSSAGVNASDIDLVIGVTMCADYCTPGLAATMSERLGIKCPAFDVNSACSGFLYAMDVAAGFYARKSVKKVLIVAADAMSRLVDWTDRATCVLFGDGSAAVVLDQGDNLLASKLTCEGNTEVLNVKRPFVNILNKEEKDGTSNYLHMNGQEVYRFAVSSMARDVADVVAEAGLTMDDVTYVLPHQANQRIIKAATDKLGIDKNRVLSNIQNYGNISAVSIPLLLDEYNKKGYFKPNDTLVFTAFGGGLTTAATAIRW